MPRVSHNIYLHQNEIERQSIEPKQHHRHRLLNNLMDQLGPSICRFYRNGKDCNIFRITMDIFFLEKKIFYSNFLFKNKFILLAYSKLCPVRGPEPTVQAHNSVLRILMMLLFLILMEINPTHILWLPALIQSTIQNSILNIFIEIV